MVIRLSRYLIENLQTCYFLTVRPELVEGSLSKAFIKR
jgi:hypothetical protein